MAKILTLLLSLITPTIGVASITLHVYNNPPLVEVKAGGEPSGISINLVDTLFNRVGVEHEFEFTPPRRALYQVLRNKNACTFPVDRNQALEAQYRWIGPVSITRYTFFGKVDETIRLTTLGDAKAYSVSVFSGSAMGEYLEQRGFTVYETSQIEQGLHMLNRGHVKLWAGDIRSARTLGERYKIAPIEPKLSFYTTINFMACNPDIPEAYFQVLSRELKMMYQFGTAQRILELEL